MALNKLHERFKSPLEAVERPIHQTTKVCNEEREPRRTKRLVGNPWRRALQAKTPPGKKSHRGNKNTPKLEKTENLRKLRGKMHSCATKVGKFGKSRENSGKLGKIRENSAKFGEIREEPGN